MTNTDTAPAGELIPDYKSMSSGEFLAALGMDAKKWADAFEQINPPTDHGTMLGWFANAIMAGYDEAERRARNALSARQPDAGEHLRNAALDAANYLSQLPRDGKLTSEAWQFAAELRAAIFQPEATREGVDTDDVKDVLNRHYVYNKAAGSYFFDVDAATAELLPYLRTQPEPARTEVVDYAALIECLEEFEPMVAFFDGVDAEEDTRRNNEQWEKYRKLKAYFKQRITEGGGHA